MFHFAVSAFLILFAVQASALTSCSVETLAASRSEDSYRFLFKKEIAPSNDRDDSILVYVKPNLQVVSMSLREVNLKKSFQDLEGAEFFGFSIREGSQGGIDDHIEISYGNVETNRSPVRLLKAFVSAPKRLALQASRFSVVCRPSSDK